MTLLKVGFGPVTLLKVEFEPFVAALPPCLAASEAQKR